MNIQIVLFASVLCLMAVGFLTERVSRDIVAALGLLTLVLSGILSPEQALSGFSSPVIVTLVCVFFVSAAIRESGMANFLALYLQRWSGGSEAKACLSVMCIAALFSSFMNNVAATALLIPTVMSVASWVNVSASRLLLPLAWGTILGGMTTLIGTPPNLLASQILQGAGYSALHFFDFTALGLTAFLVGAVFMVGFARRFLPLTAPPPRKSSGVDISQWYRLFERIFVCRIPHGSSLSGLSLEKTELGRRLGCQVIAIKRGALIVASPQAQETVHAGDLLVLGGRLSEMKALQLFHKIRVSREKSIRVEEHCNCYSLQVNRPEWIGRTIAELRLHQGLGGLVIGIEREGGVIDLNLGEVTLRQGDVLRIVSPRKTDQERKMAGELASVECSAALCESISDGLIRIQLAQDPAREGLSLRQLRVGEVLGVTIIGIIRADAFELLLDADAPLRSLDVLVAVGNEQQLRFISSLSELEVLPEAESEKYIYAALMQPETRLVEAILTPRSSFIGATIAENHFRERFGFQVLAVWRDGRPIRARLSRLVLKFGDVLLLQGPSDRLMGISHQSDFVCLSHYEGEPTWTLQSWIVCLSMFMLIALPALRIVPPEIAALIAAVVVVLGKVIRVERAYQEIDWRIVILLALLLPFGIAIEAIGAARLIGEQLMETAGIGSPLLMLAVLMAASSFISQLLDGSLAVIIIAPLAIAGAEQLSVSPYPFVMGVAWATSIAFLTPVSHKAGLLVTSLGEYSVRHFFVLGGLLSLLVFVVVLVGVQLFFPF